MREVLLDLLMAFIAAGCLFVLCIFLLKAVT